MFRRDPGRDRYFDSGTSRCGGGIMFGVRDTLKPVLVSSTENVGEQIWLSIALHSKTFHWMCLHTA